MKINFSYSQLAAEFVIVVVGVAVALAADNWRQGLSDRVLEKEYVERILYDLKNGKSELEIARIFLGEANKGARELLAQLETGIVEDDKAINSFAYAARTGGTSDQFRHSNTYLELVSSGVFQGSCHCFLFKRPPSSVGALVQPGSKSLHQSAGSFSLPPTIG